MKVRDLVLALEGLNGDLEVALIDYRGDPNPVWEVRVAYVTGPRPGDNIHRLGKFSEMTGTPVLVIE